MAPKRGNADKEDGGQKGKKSKAAEAPSFNDAWKVQKPGLVYLGDNIPSGAKVAAFDLDGTLIEWKQGMAFSLAPDSWEWFNEMVPSKLQELAEKGYKLVILTNQALIKSALNGKGAANFKAKVDAILEGAGVEAVVIAATQKDDGHRKPEIGMWSFFIEHCNNNSQVDLESSFYCGDAAGRKYDFSDSDKVFADRIKLPFKTPEEVFGDSNRPNKDMAACFMRLSEEVRASGEENSGFRANAFRKAAAALEAHRDKITSGKDAAKLPGIGKGSIALIDQFLESGEMGMSKPEARAAGEAVAEGDPDAVVSGTGSKAAGGEGSKAKAGLAFL